MDGYFVKRNGYFKLLDLKGKTFGFPPVLTGIYADTSFFRTGNHAERSRCGIL
jgi:hypothetical protein